MGITVRTSIPTLPPEQLPPGEVFNSQGGDLLLKMIVNTGAVHVRVARYLGGEWCWHPVGTLTWDPAIQDSDTTAASKTAARRYERLVCDDHRGYFSVVKVAGTGTIASADLFACHLGGR